MLLDTASRADVMCQSDGGDERRWSTTLVVDLESFALRR